ncbi:hypothetical protein ACFLXO_08010, partial [Chloroflexota bacterium]
TGLPCIAASATQSLGYASILMVDLFGVDWLRHGRMDSRFLTVINAEDTLTPTAVVQSKESKDGATRFTVEVNIDNQRGEKVLLGQASGYVGKVDPSWGADDYEKRLAELKADPTMKHDPTASPALEPLEYVVTPPLNQQFCYGEEDYKPWYIEETEIGPPITHPGLLLNWSNRTRSPSARIIPAQWGLHARDEDFFYNPVRVGQKVRVTWPGMIGTYEKRGRPWEAYQCLVVDEDGKVVLRRISHGTYASQQYKKDYKR